MAHTHQVKVIKQEVNKTNGHLTIFVRAIEKDEEGNIVGEGPETPLGISVAAMDKGFGGHGKEEIINFIDSRKQLVITAYCGSRECAESAKEIENMEF